MLWPCLFTTHVQDTVLDRRCKPLEFESAQAVPGEQYLVTHDQASLKFLS